MMQIISELLVNHQVIYIINFNKDNIRGINKELAKCREAIGTDSLEIMDRYFKKQ